MVAAFWLYSAAVALARVRGLIAQREPGAVHSGAVRSAAVYSGDRGSNGHAGQPGRQEAP
ncbi:hypothetical protein D3C78_1722000 [compost metagenome]